MRTGGSLLLGIVFGSVIAIAAHQLSALPYGDWLRLPLALGGLLAFTLLTVHWLARSCGHTNPEAAAALGALGLVPVVFFAAYKQLDSPLSATARVDGLELAAVVSAFVLIVAAGWRLTAQVCRASRATLVLSVAAGLLATVAGVSSTWERPDPSRYLASLEPVSEHRFTAEEGFEEHRPGASRAPGVGGTCIGRGCYAHVRAGGHLQPLSLRLARGTRLALHRDPSDDSLLVEADGALFALLSSGGEGEAIPTAASLAGRLAPPLSHVLLAALGLLGGLLISWQRSHHRRRQRWLEEATDGWVTARGWLEREGSEPLRVTNEGPGPVLLQTPSATERPYRGSPREVRPVLVKGPREHAICRVERRLGALDALALSWTLLLTTPMVASIARGLAP